MTGLDPLRLAAVVPAAGIGSRMQSELPKQYLKLHGRTILEHSVAALRQAQPQLPLVIALAEHDRYFSQTSLVGCGGIQTVPGGKERADSVLAALQQLDVASYDWVLVHDAARPLLHVTDLKKLVTQCQQAGCGGILAAPVRDTMKRGGPQIEQTVDRHRLWHALTPQLFPLLPLKQALTAALAEGVTITDEASAMEWAGHPVLLVEGRSDNIKVTRPEDLALAAFYLETQR
ncbi:MULTISPECIES: 2-C-methyl-D-erythritol 4-phosphate cytidylyltransferase [Alkalimonas]|uniref:2-C-methyl-D-erythritol 4-phosphate cytidylyltransferase n=1 Tax=Alkalimonas mucilaginosa TaxID=3057676 RepID=A0ABU7JHX0_9GAMM|nr:2-C-methyl-D-erythritol 4-phosphate cytidylyltransferase [Alkalimonas sp. MEB004]MEE2025294.1 2-C-methyl-D-erythritol 4-phosphate cytidylyltransferase [Alkalimonas sp. MEB004]